MKRKIKKRTFGTMKKRAFRTIKKRTFRTIKLTKIASVTSID